MHTFKASDGTVFMYNPDLSDVRIAVSPDQINKESNQVQVSGVALREFIVSNIRDGIISELEKIDINKLFGG